MIQSIITNVISSFFFSILLIWFLKPKIEIVPLICKKDNLSDNTKKPNYQFKIINKSYFKGYDINFELYKIFYIPASNNGINTKYEEIELNKARISTIDNFKPWDKIHCNFASVIGTNEDLESILKETSMALELRVSLKHHFSGLTKVFYYKYDNVNKIKIGVFDHGNKLTIS
jgi:hypothetical protein